MGIAAGLGRLAVATIVAATVLVTVDAPVRAANNPSPSSNVLYAVDASAASNVWAVGAWTNNRVDRADPLVFHFDGSTWARSVTPTFPGKHNGELHAVSTLSATNVWAAGFYRLASATRATVFHRQGQHWSAGTLLAKQNASLSGIAALSRTSVWAVGTTRSARTTYGVVLHWNGSGWSVVKRVATRYGFSSISATGPNDIWVGAVTFALHYDGSAWTGKITTKPPFSCGCAVIGARSANDVWAGLANGLWHWNGSTWTSGDQDAIDEWVAAVQPTGDTAWALANVECGDSCDRVTSYRHDGSGWTRVPMPHVGTRGNELYGLAAVTPTNLWAVGAYWTGTNGSVRKVLILHWNGTAWGKRG